MNMKDTYDIAAKLDGPIFTRGQPKLTYLSSACFVAIESNCESFTLNMKGRHIDDLFTVHLTLTTRQRANVSMPKKATVEGQLSIAENGN